MSLLAMLIGGLADLPRDLAAEQVNRLMAKSLRADVIARSFCSWRASGFGLRAGDGATPRRRHRVRDGLAAGLEQVMIALIG